MGFRLQKLKAKFMGFPVTKIKGEIMKFNLYKTISCIGDDARYKVKFGDIPLGYRLEFPEDNVPSKNANKIIVFNEFPFYKKDLVNLISDSEVYTEVVLFNEERRYGSTDVNPELDVLNVAREKYSQIADKVSVRSFNSDMRDCFFVGLKI
jgi:hypothetical protein